MSSAIDDTKPDTGNATTASVRANFTAAKSEIEALQNAIAYPMELRPPGATSLPNDDYAALQLEGADGALVSLGITALNNLPIMRQARVNGSAAAPTGILNGQVLGAIQWGGYHSGGAYDRAAAGFVISATQNWSATARGCNYAFYVTLHGTTTTANALAIGSDGSVYAGGGTTDAALKALRVTSTVRHVLVKGATSGNNPEIGASAGNLQVTSVIMPIQATTAGAPTYVKGGIYFDTTLNKLRIGGATAWETVTSV